tara:strand:+ start:10522 stop:10773 length:252 start_codon:yes stop_codon:yes gene_type:complete
MIPPSGSLPLLTTILDNFEGENKMSKRETSSKFVPNQLDCLSSPFLCSFFLEEELDMSCCFLEWAHQDLNLGPSDYESAALTN